MIRAGIVLVASLMSAAVVVPRGAAYAQAAGEIDAGAAVDAVFQSWSRPDVPGCAVGVEREGGPPLLRAYGSADLEHNVPVDSDTVFEAGSVSKQFTAASILLLVQSGKLSLSDDIRKYLPELPGYASGVTIDELLRHTSGLREWSGVATLAGWPRETRVYTNAQVLEMAARQKRLNYPAGTAYSYTNTGYNLLAVILERVAGEPLARFSHDRLFVPLGMTHTQWRDDFRRVVKGRAVAYVAAKEGYQQDMPFEDAYGNGGLLTTVGDLLRWNDALTNQELSPFVTTELQRQGTLDDGHRIPYARGLFVDVYRGAREIAHSGATAAYRSWLGRYPDAHLSIALLCNAGDANPVALAHAVADVFLPAPEAPSRAALPPEQVSQRAGLYLGVKQGLPLWLEAQSDGLHVAGGSALTVTSGSEMSAGATSYRFVDGDTVVRETPDGGSFAYRRSQAWQPSPSELSQFVGRYFSEEALSTYQVTVREGRLVATPVDRPEGTLILNPVVVDTFEAGKRGGHPVLHFERDSNRRVAGFEVHDPQIYGLAFRRVREVYAR